MSATKKRRKLSGAELERRLERRTVAAYTKVWPVLLDLQQRHGSERVRRVIRAVSILLGIESPA